MSKLSIERIKKLEEAKKVLANLIDDIDNIIKDNVTQSDVARKYNMTPQEFNAKIACRFGGKLKFLNLLTYEDFIGIYKSIELPSSRLLRNILGLEEDFFAALPEYDEAALWGILDTLTEREKDVILLRYGTDDVPSYFTLEQCADSLGISQERVRQIEARALRRLRHPSKLYSALVGYEELNELRKRNKELAFKVLDEKNKLRNAIEKNKNLLNKLETNKEFLNNLYELFDGTEKRIEELALSKRTYNGLKRANINTVADILKLNKQGLISKVRYLTRASMIEIVDKMNELGFELIEENEF